MALEFSHIFGSSHNSMTGLTQVTSSGTITENAHTVDLANASDSWAALGFYSTSAIKTGEANDVCEFWFSIENAGNWGNFVAARFGFDINAAVDSGSGLNFRARRSVGSGVTLDDSKATAVGTVLGGSVTLANSTLYKAKFVIEGVNDSTWYLDGGAFDNQQLVDSFGHDMVGQNLRLAASIWNTTASGDAGNLRLHAAFQHTDGLTFTPITVDAGADDTAEDLTYSLNATVTNSVNALTISSYAWTQTGGAGTANFTDATAVDTDVEVDVADTYTFLLTVTDMFGETATDSVEITFPPPATGAGDQTSSKLMGQGLM